MKLLANTHPDWRCRALAHRRAWVRLLVTCMLLPALQGMLGVWLVSTLAQPGQAVVEVCTANGMQWMAMEGAPHSTPGQPPESSGGLAQPCVWAAAGLSLPPSPPMPVQAPPAAPARWLGAAPEGVRVTPDTVARVLLMAPMRAPPPLTATA